MSETRIECDGLDDAIEKAKRLVELLREAQQIIDSLKSEHIPHSSEGVYLKGPKITCPLSEN